MMNQTQDLLAYFKETGFSLETEVIYKKNPYHNDTFLSLSKVNPAHALFFFGFEQRQNEMSPSILFLHELSSQFLQHVTRDGDIEITRRATELSRDTLQLLLQMVPLTLGMEFLNQAWFENIWSQLRAVFAEEIDAFVGSVAEFFVRHNTNLNVVGRVFFHLVESKDDNYPFAFLATYSTIAHNSDKALHLPLKNALIEYQNDNKTLLSLLSTVSKATDRSTFISELVESGELFSPLKFTADEAYIFLKEIPLLEECGILCRMPDWWKKKSTVPRLSIKVGGSEPPRVGIDAILSFDPEISLGDESLTKEEIEILLAQTAGLSFLKGKWIEVDHDKLRKTLEAYEQAERLAEGEGLSFADAMRLQLHESKEFAEIREQVDVQITNGEWLQNMRHQMMNPAVLKDLSAGEEFFAELRPYQQQGLNWLGLMKQLGFGALLADDMGLGKTVQVIALLEHMRKQGNGLNALLVLPASLLGNWEKEMQKFAPSLRIVTLHGSQKNGFNTDDLEKSDVFMTTYGMVHRLEELSKVSWDLLILDEAQAIKNPGIKQTKAVKQIKSRFRIALTGTPVENRLSELWSILDFLDPGLLGTTKEFSLFINHLKEDNTGYSKLRDMISPFMLRRLKTDKSIAPDLPEKMEMKTYAKLTKKQAVLYASLVSELSQKLNSAEGIERKGLVLASLMKCKQICNHPDQYMGQDIFEASHSGKFEVLAEICETIREKHERVLVFTQFKEMTAPISLFLESVFQRKGLILHGGTPVKKRSELVSTFNGEEYVPYMVLSLKAGGVGLNLTAANHVVHFDRWWNPAVENQATDRAFRIGQNKNVVVHMFITANTIEERIDEMIEEKRKLSQELLAASGENWITEMSNDDLVELFTLR